MSGSHPGQTQASSVSAPVAFGVRCFVIIGSSSEHGKMFKSISEIYPFDASSNHFTEVVTTKNVSRHCRMSPEGQIASPPQSRITGPVGRGGGGHACPDSGQLWLCHIAKATFFLRLPMSRPIYTLQGLNIRTCLNMFRERQHTTKGW